MADLPTLPHGWRMRNSNADVSGPPIPDDDSETSDLDSEIKPDSEGWEDVEDDTETVTVQCLLCSEKFPTALATIDHCKEAHDFDFVKIRETHREYSFPIYYIVETDLCSYLADLDFYTTIKFINYCRTEVAAGKSLPSTDDASLWSDDKYLQPVLEDDALLFSIDEIGGGNEDKDDDKKES